MKKSPNIPQKHLEIYRGKAKTLYSTENPDFLILHFRDDTSAGDGARIESFANKGKINNALNTFIMKKLEAEAIPTQMISRISDNEVLVKRLKMLPIECVIRNRAAGSLVKRLGIEEGKVLNPPLFELFLKDDSRHDPMVNDSYCETFGWADQPTLIKIKALSFKINQILMKLFDNANLILVDFKLEFGLYNNELTLGDEFSPDGARLWDKKTGDKFDKDRFRQQLGRLVEGYEEVARRLGVPLTHELSL